MLSDCSYTHAHTHDVIVSTSGKFMSPTLMLIQVQQSHTIKKPPLAKLPLCILFASNVPGGDPQVEEGGGPGHRYKVGLVRPCGARSAPNFFANV